METAREVERPSAGRPHSRRGVWLFLVFLTALLVGAVVLALQPHRKTFVSEPMSNNPRWGQEFPERFALEYPDDWKTAVGPGDEVDDLLLLHESPGGLTGWWRQHVQHEDATLWEVDHLIVQMRPLEVMDDIDTHERQTKKSARFDPDLSFHRIRHPLGPGLEITVSNQSATQCYYVMIWPQDRPTHRKLVVYIACVGTPAHAHQLEAALSVLLEHLHIVD